jgi:hypothetical protein
MEIKEFVARPMFDEKVILNKGPSWPKISIVTLFSNRNKFLSDNEFRREDDE